MTVPHPIKDRRRFQDLTGWTFGRWHVLYRADARRNCPQVLWWCRCECGTERAVLSGSLKNGASRSCGCWNREVLLARWRTHGKSGSLNNGFQDRVPEYNAWAAMKDRCLNPKNAGFHNYGGRGITVCERWRSSFETFLNDMGGKPSPRHTLDRLDNDGPYCKENCRWATRQEQMNNVRYNHLLTLNGETQTMAEWSRRLGIPYATLKDRLRRGWPDEKVLSVKKRPR